MRNNIEEWSKFGKTPEPKAAIEAGDLEAALSGFATREMLDYRLHGPFHSDVNVCGFGVVLWLKGDMVGAARVWLHASDDAWRGRFKYSSTGLFQSGLLLWFASAWMKDQDLQDEAATLFDKLLQKKRLVMGAPFPSLLARLLLKKVDLSEVQTGCRNEADKRMAFFYAGVRAFEAGERNTMMKLWSQIQAPTYSQCEFEYYLIAHEMKSLSR